jgi:hypothetical protein
MQKLEKLAPFSNLWHKNTVVKFSAHAKKPCSGSGAGSEGILISRIWILVFFAFKKYR